HADNVAAAIFGGFVIAEKADPTRVTRLAPPAGLRFALAIPRLELTTRRARRALPRCIPLADHAQGCARAGAIVAAIARGDVRALGRAVEGSFAERARARLVPGFAGACESARRGAAAGAAMGGAGRAVRAGARASAVRSVAV